MASRLLIRAPEKPSAEGNNFDAIRLVMALVVVWSHSFILHVGTEDGEWMFQLTNGRVTAGTTAVMVFFIISGFLISQSWERSRSARRYLEKRIRRIYPGYMVATTICAFLIVPFFSSDAQITLLGVAKTLVHNLLLRNHFPPSNAFASNPYPREVNGSLWSIPIEFACYVMVMALWFAARRKNRRLLLGMAGASLVTRVALDLQGAVPHVGRSGEALVWLQVLPSFLAGMCFYAFRDTLPRNAGLLLALGLGAILACWISPHAGNLILAPALAYGTFYVAFSDRIKFHDAARRGDFSYGTYLYAFPIQQMLQSVLGGSVSLPSFIAASMMLSLIAGIASWHVVEKHFMAQRRRPRLSQRPSPNAVVT